MAAAAAAGSGGVDMEIVGRDGREWRDKAVRAAIAVRRVEAADGDKGMDGWMRKIGIGAERL